MYFCFRIPLISASEHVSVFVCLCVCGIVHHMLCTYCSYQIKVLLLTLKPAKLAYALKKLLWLSKHTSPYRFKANWYSAFSIRTVLCEPYSTDMYLIVKARYRFAEMISKCHSSFECSRNLPAKWARILSLLVYRNNSALIQHSKTSWYTMPTCTMQVFSVSKCCDALTVTCSTSSSTPLFCLLESNGVFLLNVALQASPRRLGVRVNCVWIFRYLSVS